MRKSDHNGNRQAPSAEGIAAAVERSGRQRGPAPVHLWDPPFCGDLDIRIGRDGTWYYLGTPIGRRALVKLFASVLKREGDRHFLVTPVEKIGITVDDAPFVAVDLRAEGEGKGQTLTFTTNLDEETAAGPGNPLRLVLDAPGGEPAPYIHVRSGLEALIDRKTFYRLVDLGTEHDVDGVPHFGVWSGGVFFPFLPATELDRLSA